jgi:mannose-6-phosphate isomerase-like protein (cupin superfamily)
MTPLSAATPDYDDEERPLMTEESAEARIKALVPDPAQCVERKGKKYFALDAPQGTALELQIIEECRPRRLHHQDSIDAFWWVTSGLVHFHDADGGVIEVPAGQGVFVPQQVDYWFDKAGDEPATILHFSITSDRAELGPTRTILAASLTQQQ